MSHPLAISADNLTRYYGDRPALDDVSFDVRQGDTLVVFGANGAGKSTLLKLLSTLVRPHSGQLNVLGEELPKDSWAVRGRIGLIGHEPLVYRDLTARENLIFTAKLNNVDLDEVETILERIDLDKRADEPVRNFSRGMLQRLATARALLPDPDLLLLDEPNANLDPGAMLLLEPFIGRAGHHTRVIVTHDVDYGLEQGDIALGLKQGRTEWIQPTDRVTHDETRRLYK